MVNKKVIRLLEMLLLINLYNFYHNKESLIKLYVLIYKNAFIADWIDESNIND